MDLNTSSFLFDQLGGSSTLISPATPAGENIKFIDSNIRLVGVKTGVMIDVPVRFVRLA